MAQNFGSPVANSPLRADGADIEQAQQAMHVTVIYEQGMIATPDKIVTAVDVDSMITFESLGLVGVVIDDVDTPIS